MYIFINNNNLSNLRHYACQLNWPDEDISCYKEIIIILSNLDIFLKFCPLSKSDQIPIKCLFQVLILNASNNLTKNTTAKSI